MQVRDLRIINCQECNEKGVSSPNSLMKTMGSTREIQIHSLHFVGWGGKGPPEEHLPHYDTPCPNLTT